MRGDKIFLGEVFRHLGNVGMFRLKRKGQLLGRFGQKTDVYFGLKPGEKKRGKNRGKNRIYHWSLILFTSAKMLIKPQQSVFNFHSKYNFYKPRVKKPS